MLDQIIICLEQKEILLIKIMDLTKQIEVRSRQDKVFFEDFFKRRDTFMERVNKCERLITNLIAQLPQDQQERLKPLLNAKEGCPPYSKEEIRIFELSKNCFIIRQKAMVIDQRANAVLKKRCDELKDKINASWKKTDASSMFR